MTASRAQLDLLRALARACGAREASWGGPDRAPLRVTSVAVARRRPSWRACGGAGAGAGDGTPGRAGLLSWGPPRCARDPLLAAAGIRRLRGWRTEDGGHLLLGGGDDLDAPARELELQAGALVALAQQPGAGATGPDLQQLGLTAAGAAHDLRNLLAVAQLEIEAAGLGRPGTELRLQETLREARGVAESFLAGGGATRRQVTALAPILQRAAGRAPEIAHLPLERSIAVSAECPAEVFVVGRPDQLARVFDNLLANAVAAAAAVRGEPAHVECRVRCAGDRVQVEVVDTGPGLSARDLTRAFTPGRSASGGTGFGTSSVRHCLDLLGAELAIESTPGRGTTCRVSLRSAPAPASAVALVVSRDPALRAAWVSALRGHGIEGLGVEDATEALAWSEVLEVTGVLWARGTPGKGRAALQHALRERGRPWCDLGVRGPAPRTPGERGANRVLVRVSAK